MNAHLCIHALPHKIFLTGTAGIGSVDLLLLHAIAYVEITFDLDCTVDIKICALFEYSRFFLFYY